MKVCIDGTDVEIKAGDMTIGGLIGQVKERMQSENRFINGVEVDDERLSSVNEKTLLKKKAARRKVIFSTDSPVELTARTLDRGMTYIASFKSLLEKFSKVLENGGEEEDYEDFMEGLKGWQTVMTLFEVSRQVLGADFAKMRVEGKSVNEINAEICKLLQEVKTALASCDLVYFKDLLRYELIPMMDRVTAVMRDLRALCATKG